MIFKFRSDNLEPTFRKITEYVKDKDDFFVIEIQKSKRIRSLNQNKYYWGVVVKIIANDSGYTSDEVHQILAWKFLSYSKGYRDGVEKSFVKSTTKLNTMEFEQYLEKCRVWAQKELNSYIPLPNEITEEMYMLIGNIFERQ